MQEKRSALMTGILVFLTITALALVGMNGEKKKALAASAELLESGELAYAELETKEAETAHKLSEIEKQLSDSRAELEKTRADLEESQKQAAEGAENLRLRETELEAAEQALRELETKEAATAAALASARTDLEEKEQAFSELEKKEAETADTLVAVKKALEESEKALLEIREQESAASEALLKAETEISELRLALTAAMTQQVDTEAALQDLEAAYAELLYSWEILRGEYGNFTLGYEAADYETYYAPLEEKPLLGNRIYLDGVLTEIRLWEVEGFKILMGFVETLTGETWCVQLHSLPFVTEDGYDAALEKEILLLGVYINFLVHSYSSSCYISYATCVPLVISAMP